MQSILLCLFVSYLYQVYCDDAWDEEKNSDTNFDLKERPQFLPLTEDIVDIFHSLTWTEKIPYLFTEEEWDGFVYELRLVSSDARVSYENFIDHFSEFSDPDKIVKFWQGCDTDNDRYVDITEYAICRGDFDQNGDPYDINEYEFKVANLLADFKPSFVYDEDGIIID
jgi:hypothetical protein